jgi:cation:H+ antiporter
LVWVKLVVCVLIVLFAGRNVARYGDIIAERTGMGRVWMGVIAIAAITSLPELFTGISAVTIVKAPDLTIGNLVGANAFNLFNLALLDIYHRNESMIAVASQTHRLTSLYSILLVVFIGVCIYISTSFFDMQLGWIGWYTPVIILIYVFSVRHIFLHEKQQPPRETVNLYDSVVSMQRVYIIFSVSAVFIIGAGIWLATIGDEIALVTGWGQSFVGGLLLAFTTTLPEITVSFTAMRIGAIDMAVANLIGSNLFNLTIVSIIDLIYSKGPILAEVSQSHLVVAAAVLLMTILFIVGLRIRPRRFYRLNWLNISLVVLFVASAYLNFILS